MTYPLTSTRFSSPNCSLGTGRGASRIVSMPAHGKANGGGKGTGTDKLRLTCSLLELAERGQKDPIGIRRFFHSPRSSPGSLPTG